MKPSAGGSRLRASASSTVTFALALWVIAVPATHAGSTSMATTRPARAASAPVSVPSPQPISSTSLSGAGSSASTMASSTSRSMRKCWPRLVSRRSPTRRPTAVSVRGSVRSSGRRARSARAVLRHAPRPPCGEPMPSTRCAVRVVAARTSASGFAAQARDRRRGDRDALGKVRLAALRDRAEKRRVGLDDVAVIRDGARRVLDAFGARERDDARERRDEALAGAPAGERGVAAEAVHHSPAARELHARRRAPRRARRGHG